MWTEEIRDYFSSSVTTPFLCFLGDAAYETGLDFVHNAQYPVISVSAFSGGPDKWPNLDRLAQSLVSLKESPSKHVVVVGLGETLGLKGREAVSKELHRFSQLDLGEVRVLFLLRGLCAFVPELELDLRFDERRHLCQFPENVQISVTITPYCSSLSGIKALLETLEKGSTGDHYVDTEMKCMDSMFTIEYLSSAYDALLNKCKEFLVPCECGTQEQWGQLLEEVTQKGDSLEALFEENGFTKGGKWKEWLENEDHTQDDWLFFLYLKQNVETLQMPYLQYVLDQTTEIGELRENLLLKFIEISPSDPRFEAFYREHKELRKYYPNSELKRFVDRNKENLEESVHRLSDQSKVEKETIISWIHEYGITEKLDGIYPALSQYLKQYEFKSGEHAGMLTKYFQDYKVQKVTNQLDPDFLEHVEELAKERFFNRLPSREDGMKSLDRKKGFLYWMDALGVEFLSSIEYLAKKHGLSLEIKITRSILPTITSKNKKFFDDWEGAKKKMAYSTR